jgi:hypothetical protein
MKSNVKRRRVRDLAIFIGAIVCSATTAQAQDYNSLQFSRSPLTLAGQGSFYVGGQTVNQNTIELGIEGPTFPPGKAVINQMYVRYMVPTGRVKVPVVMVHGGILSGKSFETTPDGRMGWDEYFVRKGHTVFVPDQVARARSGFDQSIFNLVRTGNSPPASQPGIIRLSEETIWLRFRLGPVLGTPFPGTQFPVEAAEEFAKQSNPSTFAPPVVGFPNPTIQALSDLAVKTNGIVIMTHSQSSVWGLDAFLSNPKGIKGSVLVEPQNCTAYTDAQIAVLTKLPILVVFADHIEVAERQVGFDQCKTLATRINGAGGNATFVHLPTLGIRDNTHMMMLDKNNLKIADLIMDWMDKNVPWKEVVAWGQVPPGQN